MTTAARPTFSTAKGGGGQRERDLSALSKQYSSRDLPSHTSLKTRDRGQVHPDDLKNKDFRRDLEERERIAAREKRDQRRGERGDHRALQSSSTSEPKSDAGPSSSKKSRVEPANLDADDPVDASDDSSSDDSDDEDAALLMMELQKIKQEKAMEEQEKQEEYRTEEERIRMENILSGNPLLKERYSGDVAGEKGGDLRVKRRWDEDVVFKNCSRAQPDKSQPTFINDTIRSEFHKKFMDKYIK